MGSEWTQTTVGSFCPFSYGKGLPEKKRIPNGRFIVYGSNGPVGTHDQPLVNEPGIVIGRKGTVGAVHFASKPFWPIDTTYYVLSASGRHLRYTYYLLKSIGLENMNADSAVPGLNRNAVHAKQILVPSYDEQHAIAHILGSLDDKIELNRRMNQTLEAIARAIFKSWFIDFDPVIDNALRAGNPIPDLMAERAEIRRQILDQNQPTSSNHRAKGRDYQGGFDSSGLGEVSIDEIHRLFPDSFQASELGAIPKGWEVKEIGEVVKCVGGSTPSTNNPAFWDSGKNPFVTPKDMSSLKSPVILETSRYITDAGVNKISSGLLPIGTVILSSRAPIGYLAITEVPVSINQGIIAMICNKDLPNYYMLYWTDLNMETIKSNAGGTTFAEISKRNFRPIPVIIPSKIVLNTFAQQVGPLHRQMVFNQQESVLLSSLRDTLLPKLISGELRIQDAEKFVEEIGL